MRRLFPTLRMIAIIGAVTLAIDFLVTLLIPARILDPWAQLQNDDLKVYDLDLPWHHEFKRNVSLNRTWGGELYLFRSDQHGLRTGTCAGMDAAAEKDKTVFIIGDSFVEGLGLPFEQTLAGLLACAYRARGLVARNLGVAGYSPVIYWRRIEEIARRLDLKPKEIVVFLDISDIHTDAVDYGEENGRIVSRAPAEPPDFSRQTKTFFKRNSMTFAAVAAVMDHLRAARFDTTTALDKEAAMWTLDAHRYLAWGRRGLERNAANLERIVRRCAEWRCRMTLAVYPWPDQIMHGDRDSLQVWYWRDWSVRNGVRFVDAFGPFFELPARQAIERYYLIGDVHLNAAGHRLLFEEAWKALKD